MPSRASSTFFPKIPTGNRKSPLMKFALAFWCLVFVERNAAFNPSTHLRVPENAVTVVTSSPELRANPFIRTSRSSCTTNLRAKLWDRLEIEEDPEPMWYLLNCVATQEIDLLRQCRAVTEDMPDAIKFVVPTVRKTRSHGANKMVTETKVKYQGYVFGKLRLCPEVYEAIQNLDLCRSWMGTVNHKGYKKLPPAPLSLNEIEVENFGLEEWEGLEEEEEEDPDAVIVDNADEDVKPNYDVEALEVYLGLRVDDMVKVTKKNKFFDEDGIVRRLKEGQIFVRFYTYGTMFEEWLDPGDVRKLTNDEVVRGLSGPSQPITQQDFDGPDRNPRNFDERRPGSLRNTLMSSTDGGSRNRRQDRTQRSHGQERDRFGRSNQELAREDRNWEWYKDQKKEKQTDAADSDWSMRAQTQRGRDSQWAERDVDSQWGRKPQRPERRESQTQRKRQENRRAESAIEGNDDWSTFVSPSRGSSSSAPAVEEDDFFVSLMTDLSKDLGSDQSSKSSASAGSKHSDNTSDEDDFFASLMSEIEDKEEVSSLPPPQKIGTPKQKTSSPDDDFFASLEAELGKAVEERPEKETDDAEDFFARLEAEIAPTLDPPLPNFRGDGTNQSEKAPTNSSPPPLQSVSKRSSLRSDDLGKKTMPALKEMLKERGLKVSGKKAELIDRLQHGS
jgi:transcription antitermination factor NusG